MNARPSFGAWGEDEAARFLQKKGLYLVDRHFQTRWGEIDLIFRDHDTMVFVEVKTRRHASQPSALDALTPAKQKKMVGVALLYMKKHRLADTNLRFDVVTIEAGHVEWLPNAFEPPALYTF